MSAAAAATAAIAGIGRLSALGLPGHEVIPPMLRRLHGAVASATNSFHWVDVDGRPSGWFGEPPYVAEVARLSNEFQRDARGAPALPAHRIFGAGRRAVRRTPLPPRFHDSEAYRNAWQPRGIHHALEAVVDGGQRPLGVLVLYRGPDDPDFEPQDLETVSTLLPLFARACSGPPSYDGERAAASPPAFAVVGLDGEFRHAGPDARLRLALALHPCLNHGCCKRGCANADAGVTAKLRSMCAALPAAPQQTTTLRLRNAWGHFTLQVQPLQPVHGESTSLVGVAIEHEVPLPVAVDVALERSALSPRQRELCLLLVAGCSYAAVGERMGISEQTAISYARVIFAKLDARCREDLLRRLLLAPRSA
jgi:DNA-binding CsgD family transcriptional regulator